MLDLWSHQHFLPEEGPTYTASFPHGPWTGSRQVSSLCHPKCMDEKQGTFVDGSLELQRSLFARVSRHCCPSQRGKQQEHHCDLPTSLNFPIKLNQGLRRQTPKSMFYKWVKPSISTLIQWKKSRTYTSARILVYILLSQAYLSLITDLEGRLDCDSVLQARNFGLMRLNDSPTVRQLVSVTRMKPSWITGCPVIAFCFTSHLSYQGEIVELFL